MPAEGAKGCSSESGIIVLKHEANPGKGAPYRCCHAGHPDRVRIVTSTITALVANAGLLLPATLAQSRPSPTG